MPITNRISCLVAAAGVAAAAHAADRHWIENVAGDWDDAGTLRIDGHAQIGLHGDAGSRQQGGLLEALDFTIGVATFEQCAASFWGDPLADLDESGIIDLGDIGAFVGAFTGGCN